MLYTCMKVNLFKLEHYTLVPIRKEDILPIKDWRNAQIDVLRQKKYLTDEEQLRYFQEVVKPTFSQKQPPMLLFSYLYQDTCIGYGGLTHIDWESQRAEVSFLVNPERTLDEKIYRTDFSTFLSLLKKVTFEELKFNRLYTETFDIRPLHIAILEENGFILEGRLKEHVFIQNRYVDSLIHGYLKGYYHVEK